MFADDGGGEWDGTILEQRPTEIVGGVVAVQALMRLPVEVEVADIVGAAEGLVVVDPDMKNGCFVLSNESPQSNWRDCGTRYSLAAGVMNPSAHPTVLETSVVPMGEKSSRSG